LKGKRDEQDGFMKDITSKREKLKKDKEEAYSKRKIAAENEAKAKAAKAEKA